MASRTALPIARLRSLGCKVSTIIGHDPNIGDWKYSVRVPDARGDLRSTSEDRLEARNGSAIARVPALSDGHHVVIEGCLYSPARPLPDRATRRATEADVAGLLNSIADALSKKTGA